MALASASASVGMAAVAAVQGLSSGAVSVDREVHDGSAGWRRTDALFAHEGVRSVSSQKNYEFTDSREFSSATAGSRRLHQHLEGRRSRTRSTVVRAEAVDGSGVAALRPELKKAIDDYISEHKVVLFMKGNKAFPMCGFSNTCVQILSILNVPFQDVNILENEEIRQGMKEYSKWPTFPQLYVDKEFIGGCDIMIELYQSGELKEMLEKALVS